MSRPSQRSLTWELWETLIFFENSCRDTRTCEDPNLRFRSSNKLDTPSILQIELLSAEKRPLGPRPTAFVIERPFPSSTALQSSLRSCSRQGWFSGQAAVAYARRNVLNSC